MGLVVAAEADLIRYDLRLPPQDSLSEVPGPEKSATATFVMSSAFQPRELG